KIGAQHALRRNLPRTSSPRSLRTNCAIRRARWFPERDPSVTGTFATNPKDRNMSLAWILLALASFVGVVAASYLVEALRRTPKPPEQLAWAAGIPIRYADVGGLRLRFLRAGAGPNLVLLHTLRTQLDLFEKVVPDL